MRFRLIDTAVEKAKSGTLEARMRLQTGACTAGGHYPLVIDGRAGLLPEDLYFAQQISEVERVFCFSQINVKAMRVKP